MSNRISQAEQSAESSGKLELLNAEQSYAGLTGRIILSPFDLPRLAGPLPANITNHAESKETLESLFKKSRISVVLQGGEYAIIVPSEYTNFVKRYELKQPKPVPVSSNGISKGGFVFPGVDVRQMFPIYCEMVGSKGIRESGDYQSYVFQAGLNHHPTFLSGSHGFSKDEVKYGFDQLFAYYGFRLISADDHYLKVELLSH